MIKLLVCPPSHCEYYDSSVSIQNIVFTGSLNKEIDSVIKTEHVTFIVRNVTFDIDQKGVSRKRWYVSHTSRSVNVPVKLINVTINATSMPIASSVAVVSSEQLYLENFEIFCPQGLAVVNVSSIGEEQFSCEEQCPTDAYTFQAGSAVINGNKHSQYSPYNITSSRSQVNCKVCPLGANCTGSIKALPHYWGYKDSQNDSVTIIRCPDEYCCDGNDTCDGINSCNARRTGNICGKCQKGLSEALFSTECISAEKCFGALALLYYTICVIIYIAFLASYKDLQKYATTKVKEFYKKLKDKLYFHQKNNDNSNSNKDDETIEENIQDKKKHCDIQRRSKSENENSHEENKVPDNQSDDSTKYIQILFFYIQDAILFKVNIPGQTYQKKGTIEKILSFSPKILTLTYSKVIHTCFSYAKTPMSKILFEMLFGLYFIVILWLLYLILKIVSKFLKKTSNIWPKFKSCLMRALLLGVLFSYQNLIMGAFTLVRCVDVANDKVLHIEGDIQCYNWWQYLVMGYIIFFLVPVFLAVSHFPYYIKDKHMSVKTFIISCLFPTPVMLYYVMIELRRKILSCRVQLLIESIPVERLGSDKKSLDTQVNIDAYAGPKDLDIPFIDEDSKYDSNSSSDESSIVLSSNDRKNIEIETRLSVDLPVIPVKTMSYSKSEIEILNVLLEHYKELNLLGMRFTWLCIHKLYRIALVACNTFITEPISRLCLMTLVLIIVATIANTFVKPYNDYKANLTASFSYAANLCLAMLNIFKTALVTFDCKSNCSFQRTVLLYFDLTENALISYIPCVFIAAWFVFFMVQKCGVKNKKD